jgi:hypothetical protein
MDLSRPSRPMIKLVLASPPRATVALVPHGDFKLNGRRVAPKRYIHIG